MNVVVILIGQRMESAVKVQSILTQNGDIIRTRLGINRDVANTDNGSGFIFLELCGDENRANNLCTALNAIENVKAECLKMELPVCGCSI